MVSRERHNFHIYILVMAIGHYTKSVMNQSESSIPVSCVTKMCEITY